MHDESNGESGAANIPPFPRSTEPDSTPASPPRAGAADSSRDAEDDESVAGPDAGAGARPEAEGPPPKGAERIHGEGRPRAPGMRGDGVRGRAERGVLRGLENIADRLEDAAARIDRIAEARFPGARQGDVAHSAAARLEDVADYLRNADLGRLKADLDRQVRENPLQSLLLAAGVGWVFGKIMR